MYYIDQMGQQQIANIIGILPDNMDRRQELITAAARRFHVIDELITDDQTALAILELLEKES